MNEHLSVPRIYLGCDPEFFFTKEGKVVGAEKVLTAPILAQRYGDATRDPTGVVQPFVIDGVQVELNPRPHTCRANLAAEIGSAFRALRVHLSKMDQVTATFQAVVEVDKAELDSLSDKAKVFGCAPSLNSYDKGATVGVDASTYLKRSAGGHIHLGLDPFPEVKAARERLVPALDILLGNTFVLIDRDPEAVERRKVYGRAGEFRLPDHGLEYRTLSNVWLRACPLMSLAMGMAKVAAGILYTTLSPELGAGRWDAEQRLLDMVPLDRVREAINQNDLALARENFAAVEKFLTAHRSYGAEGLTRQNLPTFRRFLTKLDAKGLEGIFPEDPLTHWCAITDGHEKGWESFLQTQ